MFVFSFNELFFRLTYSLMLLLYRLIFRKTSLAYRRRSPLSSRYIVKVNKYHI